MTSKGVHHVGLSKKSSTFQRHLYNWAIVRSREIEVVG
jgi:hypothetical protein